MTESQQTVGRALIERFLDREHEAIFARADFGGIFASFDDHARLWSVEPDPLGRIIVHQGLGAACLYLSSRPLDEELAWTLNFSEPSQNVFVTGSTKGRITARWFGPKDGVKKVEQSRLYVDSRRSMGPARRSVVEIEGLDVLSIFEQFALSSDQADARWFALTDREYLMVQSLPVDEKDWIRGLDAAAAERRLEGLPRLDEREFWFQCGCTRERVARAVSVIWNEDPEALFASEATIDVTCPRCGRRWTMSRSDMEN